MQDFQTTESTDSLYTGGNAATQGEVSDSVFPQGNGGNVINVSQFGGDIKSAIGAAKSGDTVVLGGGNFNASDIIVDKDITIDGGGATVDGGGSGPAVFNLTADADGATIKNMEITNANNGIYGFSASDVTLQGLDINNIGINQPIRDGENNTGITLNQADRVKILDSNLSNIGRKGIGLGDTVGGMVDGVTVDGVNLAAQHAQNHDTSGVKFFNTTDCTVQNSRFSNMNAHAIWNDTNTGTKIKNNTVTDVGSDFIAPGFNSEVGSIYGIYDEKSHNSDVSGNNITAVDGFTAYNATEFTSESLSLGENNFTTQEIGTTDFYANEQAEKLVATTADPTAADFNLFASDYYAGANLGT